jgi:hypothetical protein
MSEDGGGRKPDGCHRLLPFRWAKGKAFFVAMENEFFSLTGFLIIELKFGPKNFIDSIQYVGIQK